MACSDFESEVLALYWFLLERVTIIIQMLHHVKCITLPWLKFLYFAYRNGCNCWGCLRTLYNTSCDQYTNMLFSLICFFFPIAAICSWLKSWGDDTWAIFRGRAWKQLNSNTELRVRVEPQGFSVSVHQSLYVKVRVTRVYLNHCGHVHVTVTSASCLKLHITITST